MSEALNLYGLTESEVKEIRRDFHMVAELLEVAALPNIAEYFSERAKEIGRLLDAPSQSATLTFDSPVPECQA